MNETRVYDLTWRHLIVLLRSILSKLLRKHVNFDIVRGWINRTRSENESTITDPHRGFCSRWLFQHLARRQRWLLQSVERYQANHSWGDWRINKKPAFLLALLFASVVFTACKRSTSTSAFLAHQCNHSLAIPCLHLRHRLLWLKFRAVSR